ncbi:kelch-like protein 5 [Zeugodacus cucurbitae]|uniref:kelch-like protein 5 n=1 Tax=Zeugodacus cucurbitae TaxID=28588 RepID=UPI0023D93AC3|nr:kelch-like protein 5 [Zeugodacus cucurbitae]
MARICEKDILFFGGYESSSNTVLKWNIRSKTWGELPAMNQSRRLPSVVELDDKIYAIGGRGDDKMLLQSVEMYTTSSGWEFVKPLITARYSTDAVTLNGKIYVLGGLSKNILNDLKSVECYNPDSNTWTSCADMIKGHYGTGAAAHNGHIYVSGGSGNLYRAVERYDPQRDTWSEICCLNTDGTYCSRIAFASLDNKLWTIGGLVGSGRKANVSVYDEENDCWIKKSLLSKGSIYFCFVVPASLLPSN